MSKVFFMSATTQQFVKWWRMNRITPRAWPAWIAFLTAISMGQSTRQSVAAADLVLLNGLVYTLNPQQPLAEAVAVRGNTIAAVGSTDEMTRYEGPRTKVIDLRGRVVLPGLIDNHVHFFWGCNALQDVDLNGASTADEVEKRITRFATAHRNDKWIFGGGWQEGMFPPSGLPSKELLDKAVPDRPAVMTDLDHHALWVNSRALEAAGITKDTPNLNGKLRGRVVRDPKTGEPTGVLEEGATQLITRVMPPMAHKEQMRRLRMGLRFANELGITSMVNASGDLHELRIFDELRKGGELTVRMTTAFTADRGTQHTISADKLTRFEEARRLYHDDWVKSNLVNFPVDGAQQTHDAALQEPHADPPGERGRVVYRTDELERLYTELDRRGFQIMTHASDDAATRSVLDAYEALEQTNGPRDRRLRIEDSDINPTDIPRFAKLHVIASIQFPAPGTTSWRDITETGAATAFGSDWPRSNLNPFVAIQDGLTMQPPDGKPTDERSEIEKLVSGYTRGAAYAEFMDAKLGCVEPGKLADLIVLSQNVFAIPAAEVSRTRVQLTMVGGWVVWRNGI